MKSEIVSFDKVYSPVIKSIRTRVFVEEQGIDSTIDFDGLDVEAIHVLISLDGRCVGTGRMLNDGHIGRIAVLKDCRKQGVGKLIIKAIIAEARRQKFKRVYLGSQMPAVGFYHKLGFNICGEMFFDAGLEHIEMKLIL